MDKEPVSKICDENDLLPSVFYQWLCQAAGNLGAALGLPVSEKPRVFLLPCVVVHHPRHVHAEPVHCRYHPPREPTLVVDWLNGLKVAKAVAILDTGGSAMFHAGERLAANRYVLSSLCGSTLSRNGFITWYVRRALQKLGPNVTLRLLYEILRQADDAFGRRQFVYLHGIPGDNTRTITR